MKDAGYEEVARRVSRETLERLEIYSSELSKWQSKVNLVAPNTLSQMWNRHFFDSLQIVALAPDTTKTWLDLGSGAGFPGMVCAIVYGANHPACRFTLVESDSRKAAFLRHVARQTDAHVNVVVDRIEDMDTCPADLLTARALAPLSKLLEYSIRHWTCDTVALFHKGKSHEAELLDAHAWQMTYERIPSLTELESAILRIKDLAHA